MVMAQAYREAFDRDPLLSVEAGASELAVAHQRLIESEVMGESFVVDSRHRQICG